MSDNDGRLEALRDALRTFDLPDYRKDGFTVHGLRWLARNLAVRNSGHPRFSEALAMVKETLRERYGIKDS